MKLNITCHHINITPAIEEHIHNKFKKIINHFSNVIDVKFTLTVEKKLHTAESTIHLPKHNIHAEASDNDMYHAIEMLINKLDKQVIKYKEKALDQRQKESLKHKKGD
jgi:putative sigma-54 modulation protein